MENPFSKTAPISADIVKHSLDATDQCSSAESRIITFNDVADRQGQNPWLLPSLFLLIGTNRKLNHTSSNLFSLNKHKLADIIGSLFLLANDC